jgi:transposase-like protein
MVEDLRARLDRIERVRARLAGSAAVPDGHGTAAAGALGFWAAIRDVFPETRWQRDWVHKVANTLNAPPASVQPAARRALRGIWDAEDKSHAERALDAFARDFAKWPKAVSKLTSDRDALLAFYDYPAEHWIHLRTSNPIESRALSARSEVPFDRIVEAVHIAP